MVKRKKKLAQGSIWQSQDQIPGPRLRASFPVVPTLCGLSACPPPSPQTLASWKKLQIYSSLWLTFRAKLRQLGREIGDAPLTHKENSLRDGLS